MKNTKLVLKIGAVMVPVVMAVLTGIYGDVTPIIRDLCEAALPSEVPVHEVVAPSGDAGAAR